MVVLLTPHIVKEGADLERLTKYKVNDYYDKNVEELFKAGFFKKVKTKYDVRNQYRPTMRHSEFLTGHQEGGDQFERGDIQR
jgi:hypothetical protein